MCTYHTGKSQISLNFCDEDLVIVQIWDCRLDKCPEITPDQGKEMETSVCERVRGYAHVAAVHKMCCLFCKQ